MKRMSWVAAAATVIALAIPGVAAADSICLVEGHHWDAGDRGSKSAGELEGRGFSTVGSLIALAVAQPASVSQPVAVNVSSNGGTTAQVGNTTPAPAAGIIQQLAPVAFTSVPPTPVVLATHAPLAVLPGLLTGNVAGTVLGSLPLAGGGALILVSVGQGNGLVGSTEATSPTPEPASLILLGTGLVGTIVRKRWFA